MISGDISVKRQMTSWTVNVVPISAPKIMARELEKLINPALTSPMVRTVDAEELWKAIVETMPVSNPEIGLPTAYFMNFLIRTSINFLMEEERLTMPIRNKMTPLTMIKMSFIAKFYSWLSLNFRLAPGCHFFSYIRQTIWTVSLLHSIVNKMKRSCCIFCVFDKIVFLNNVIVLMNAYWQIYLKKTRAMMSP